MLLSESRNPGCPEGLERWSWGLPGRSWNHGASAVSAGKQKKTGGHWDCPLLSPQALPPLPPEAVWKPDDKRTWGIGSLQYGTG